MTQRDCKMLEEYMFTFQTIMLDMLQRRSLFRALEESLLGKDGSIADNMFVKFYAADYLRSQLTDLRKFFENDSRSYKLSFILDHLIDASIKQEHKNMFENRWKNDKEYQNSLMDIANKAFMHKEVGFDAPNGVKKTQLDSFIDDLNIFLNELIGRLTNEDCGVRFLERSPDSDFLKNQQKTDFKGFLKVANNI